MGELSPAARGQPILTMARSGSDLIDEDQARFRRGGAATIPFPSHDLYVHTLNNLRRCWQRADRYAASYFALLDTLILAAERELRSAPTQPLIAIRN